MEPWTILSIKKRKFNTENPVGLDSEKRIFSEKMRKERKKRGKEEKRGKIDVTLGIDLG